MASVLLTSGLAVLPLRPAQAAIPHGGRSYVLLSENAIAWGAARWAVSYGWLLQVARCESGLYPGAYNPHSGAVGLFQFMPGTYYAWAARIGEWRSPYNAFAAANVAAFMFARGQAYQWACA